MYVWSNPAKAEQAWLVQAPAKVLKLCIQTQTQTQTDEDRSAKLFVEEVSFPLVKIEYPIFIFDTQNEPINGKDTSLCHRKGHLFLFLCQR